MKVNVYCVHDSKAKAFGQPFYSLNDQTCTRSIVQCALDPQHQFCTNPEDFDLYRLGVYEDQDGSFVLLDSPQHMHKVLVLKDQYIAAHTKEEPQNG